MELRLMELRKRAGFRNRDEFASKIGVNKHTYKSWETGAAMMSLEQAFDVAEALGCSLDDLIEHQQQIRRTIRDRRQNLINDAYEAMNENGKLILYRVTKSLEKDPDNRSRVEYALVEIRDIQQPEDDEEV